MAAALVLVVLLIGSLAARWLLSNAKQEAPVGVAREFVRHLYAKQYSDAFALAAPSPYVGSSSSELERISGRQLCGLADHVVSTAPPQTNGNRLRRWFANAEVEMPEVSVEFEGGPCLLSVTLRRRSDQSNSWRVYKFMSHAG